MIYFALDGEPLHWPLLAGWMAFDSQRTGAGKLAATVPFVIMYRRLEVEAVVIFFHLATERDLCA